jgi:hypothetical protein
MLAILLLMLMVIDSISSSPLRFCMGLWEAPIFALTLRRRHGHKLLFDSILNVSACYTTCNTEREVQYSTVRDLPVPQ